MNTSATGGYIQPGPTSPFSLDVNDLGLDEGFWDGLEPLEDAALDDFLQGLISGITGLPGPMVRPRWQPEPPDFPPGDWAAIGEIEDEPDPYAAQVQLTRAGYEGTLLLLQNESLTCLCSFYGPNAGANAKKLINGIQLSQNREILILNGFGFRQISGPRVAPEQVKNKWVRRVDASLVLVRMVGRLYPVEDVNSAEIVISTETSGSETVNVTQG